jgi:glycine cleavage system transcriptional repressor
MPGDFVINVLAGDRVGIVAAVTRTITDRGGNIDAISQTVMRGYFTLILTVHFDRSCTADAVRDAVQQSGEPDEFHVSVVAREAVTPAKAHADTEQFVLSILGKDRPGVVSRITAYLASRNINIEDLYAYTQGDEFILIGQVVMLRHVDVRQIQIDLESLPMGGGLEIRLQHRDIFVATNEIEFRHKELKKV